MRITTEKEYYKEIVEPVITHEKIRASARRALKRLSLFCPRHVIHLRNYQAFESSNTPVKTMARDIIILPNMVGRKIMVHSGKKYVMVIPSEKEIGFRLGEMAYPKMALHKHTSKTAKSKKPAQK